MKPRIKFGLIVGLIGLVLNICASFTGLCGPFIALFAGGTAGSLAAQQEKAVLKRNGARLGAVAGALAGGLVLIGQLLGELAALAFVQFSGLCKPYCTVPDPAADFSQQIVYYGAGLGMGLGFGLVGILAAALAGAIAGYVGTPDQMPSVEEEEKRQFKRIDEKNMLPLIWPVGFGLFFVAFASYVLIGFALTYVLIIIGIAVMALGWALIDEFREKMEEARKRRVERLRR